MNAALFDSIRSSCARVAAEARCVGIERERLDALALELVSTNDAPVLEDPAQHFAADAQVRLVYVICLDALNFGSGWFPLLRKPPGLSGYFTIATRLAGHFRAQGAPRPQDLVGLQAPDCARILGQQGLGPEVDALMALFARSLNDLGEYLLERFDGSFEALVAAAGARAETLVELLAGMPLYRDVAQHPSGPVPFYKRAQITAADLARNFGGEGPGRFDDLDRLTLFADNLVPHVLRCEGVLVYDARLAARIDAEQLLESGSPEEIEIRALALHAVEVLLERLAGLGAPTTAQALDQRLWLRGQQPRFKARPRHRCRCPYY